MLIESLLPNFCAFHRCSQVFCRGAPTTAFKGQRELMEWCCLPKESHWLWGLGTYTSRVAPSAGSYGRPFHPRDQTLSNSNSTRSSDSPIFIIPQRVVLAAPPHRYYLSLSCALYLLLLWGFAVNRNSWISNTPSVYHVRGTPCILTFDSENVLIPSLESSQCERRGKSIYVVLWKDWAFLVSGGKVRVHENYPWHSLLEPGLHFAMEIKMKLLLINWGVRV